MADPPSSPATMESNQPDNPNSNPDSNQSDPLPVSSTSTPPPPSSSPAPVTANPSPNNPSILTPPPPPPAMLSYTPPPISVVPPTAPSFRPAPPQFSLLPTPQNLAYQNAMNAGVQPPGVSHGPVMVPGMATGAVSASVSMPLMMNYQIQPGQPPNPAMRPYMTMPNGYGAIPVNAPLGTLPPPGVLRYPSPYAIRPAFAPRPPGVMGMLPVLPRPPFPGIPGIRPFIPSVVRPVVLPTVSPVEKPQTTVYVGKIAPTVENDFMLSLLRLCGPVKSWKRAQDPSDGTPKGFGFCEFESAEGVLRGLRLLSKFNIDGQELVLNVNQATREYLERYVEKKTENSKKLKESEVEGDEKVESNAPGADENKSPKPSEEESKKDDIDSGNKESQDTANFGIVTDEDKEADREALEKLASMIEERIKTRPLPPPPPPPPVQSATDTTGNSKSELPSRDGDSDMDIMKNDATDDKNDEDTTSENKPANDHDRPETGSPNRSRRYDRGRDRERDLKREKEREFEKLEREAQRERERKERERDRKVQEAERAEREYKERVKEWESREREKERQRQAEKEREKERERKRKKEIKDDESDDDDSRKRLRRSVLEEKRRKRLREKEDDLDDRRKEDEEMVEAKRRENEEQEQRQQQQQEDALKLLSGHVTNKSEDEVAEEVVVESKDKAVEQAYEDDSDHINHIGDEILQNGMGDDSTMTSTALSDTRQNSNAPARKLGFGLVGSGKRTAVPSVFTVEEDDAQNDTKMRPLVPIDYSNEELQAVQPSNAGGTPPNLAAAAEFAKRISNVNPKEEKPDAERERSRRSYDKSSQRDRDRSYEDNNRHRDENREKNIDRERDRERGPDKLKTPDNKKLLDAKQLIDMIPKTKEELFSYEINWAVYDKHELHERMRPWISKKITEFLGEEEHTLVDYIVSSTQEHVKASQMLELLQSILDDEAEMFVLKMWRMLIFEIKKVETGLALRSKA